MNAVWVNGCWDLLHAGHIAFLQDAAELGPILLVGVNTDASVRRLKGPSRPHQDFGERVRQLLALRCVSVVVGIDHDTPDDWICTLQPAIVAKGDEYLPGGKPCPERAVVESYGGEIYYLPRKLSISTTAVLAALKRDA